MNQISVQILFKIKLNLFKIKIQSTIANLMD